MSLCLVNIHGDIEGDYEIIADLPRNPTNGDMIKAVFPDLAEYLFLNVYEEEWWDSPYRKDQK